MKSPLSFFRAAGAGGASCRFAEALDGPGSASGWSISGSRPELQKHAEANKLSIAQLAMANEVAVSGKTEAEINAFIDKIITAMVNTVKAGLEAAPGTLPGPIKLKTKAGEVYRRAMDDQYEKQRGLGVVAAYALAGSEENARGHLVITAPTGGSAGVLPVQSSGK